MEINIKIILIEVLELIEKQIKNYEFLYYFNVNYFSLPNELNNLLNSTSDEYMIKYHNSIGRVIRNCYLCTKDGSLPILYNYFLENNISHPDDMSDFILRMFWHIKHNNLSYIDDIETLTNKLFKENIIKNIIE